MSKRTTKLTARSQHAELHTLLLTCPGIKIGGGGMVYYIQYSNNNFSPDVAYYKKGPHKPALRTLQ